MRRLRPHLTYARVVATLALFIALGSTGVAAPVADQASTLAGKVKKALGLSKKANARSKKALKTAKVAKAKAEEALAKGGPAGAQGPIGPQGPQGEQGPAGTNGTNGTNGADGAPGANGSDGASAMMGGSGAGTLDSPGATLGTVQYLAPSGNSSPTLGDAAVMQVSPNVPTIARDLHVNYTVGPNPGGSVRTATLMADGTPTTLTCSVGSDAVSTGPTDCGSGSLATAIPAGTRLSIRVLSQSGTSPIGAAAVRFGFRLMTP